MTAASRPFEGNNLARLSVQEISTRLRKAIKQSEGRPRQEVPALSPYISGTAKPAAVLLPLLKVDGEWHLLFTRRNANLPEHSGQVAFPGGRADPQDDLPETTALREAWEEIGLLPGDVTILGRLSEFITITNYLVTPIVGIIPWPYKFDPAVEEVSRIFTIPLAWLSDPNNYEVKRRDLPQLPEPIYVIYFREYDGEVLWGASARFTLTFLEALAIKT